VGVLDRQRLRSDPVAVLQGAHEVRRVMPMAVATPISSMLPTMTPLPMATSSASGGSGAARQLTTGDSIAGVVGPESPVLSG
jgi:hypothetical protein